MANGESNNIKSGYESGWWITISVAVGVGLGLGLIFDSPPIGITLGSAIGTAIGMLISRIREKGR